MKKVSLSLFATLAIVLALTSAFSSKKAAPDQTVRANVSLLATPVSLTQGYAETNYSFFQTKTSFSQSDINTIIANHCATNQNLVCFVINNTIDGLQDPSKRPLAPIVVIPGQWF